MDRQNDFFENQINRFHFSAIHLSVIQTFFSRVNYRIAREYENQQT